MKSKFVGILKEYRKLFIVGISLLFLLLLIRLLGVDYETAVSYLHILLKPYTGFAEKVALPLIHLFNDGASFLDHKLVFTGHLDYFEENKDVLSNWSDYLLYLKWSVFLVGVFWLSPTPVKRKLIFSGLFAFFHFFSVLGGLVLIAGVGPYIVDVDSLAELRPHTIGSIVFFILFILWFSKSYEDLKAGILRTGIEIDIPRSRINEALVIFMGYLLIVNVFVPYFNHYSYIEFMLQATKKFVAIFGMDSTIKGPYIIGPNNGRLFMAKWCLGIVTMYVFSALVYISRKDNRSAWFYILCGIVFLHIVNIVRLGILLFYIQTHNDTDMVMDHHDMYSIIVYSIIFILWVFWYERFVIKERGMPAKEKRYFIRRK